jgi:branched-subunit amino acid ABC-type transport system permease component
MIYHWLAGAVVLFHAAFVVFVIAGGFIEHYVLRRLYPSGLTPPIRWLLGTLALVLNIAAYTLIVRQRAQAAKRPGT